MAYSDLRAFIQRLEEEKQLKRIPFEVDPYLEITEFADRSVKTGGPALLFEKPKGSKIPVLINAFASARRMELALEVDSVQEHADRIVEMLELRMPQGLINKLKLLPKLAGMASFFPKTVSGGPCKEVIRKDNFSLRSSPFSTAGRRTRARSSRCRWSSRKIRKPASGIAACIACRFTTTGPPACIGRRRSRAPSITGGC